MKKIEAIVRSVKIGAVCQALDEVGHPGVMVSEVDVAGFPDTQMMLEVIAHVTTSLFKGL